MRGRLGHHLPVRRRASASSATMVVPEFRSLLEERAGLLDRASCVARSALERRTVQIADVLADPEYELSDAQGMAEFPDRTAVPMTPGGRAASESSRCCRRRSSPSPTSKSSWSRPSPIRPSSPSRTSGCSSELQARTFELTRSVEELQALSAVSRAVSSTLDLQTVLDTVVSRAVQLSGAHGGVIYEYEETTQEFSPPGQPPAGRRARGGGARRADPARRGHRGASRGHPGAGPGRGHPGRAAVRSHPRPDGHDAARLSVAPGGPTPLGAADHGRLTSVAPGGRELRPGDREPPPDLRRPSRSWRSRTRSSSARSTRRARSSRASPKTWTSSTGSPPRCRSRSPSASS